MEGNERLIRFNLCIDRNTQHLPRDELVDLTRVVMEQTNNCYQSCGSIIRLFKCKLTRSVRHKFSFYCHW